MKALLSPIALIRVLLVLGIGAFFWFLIFGDQGAYQLRKLFLMKQHLEARKHSLQHDIERLTEKQTILSDPEKLEMVIRRELGAIRPGEIIFEARPEQD